MNASNPSRPPKQIVLSDRAGLPFSKGVLANSIMATGIPPSRAYEVAERLEMDLNEAGRKEITRVELRKRATALLEQMVGKHFAELYVKWQLVRDLDKPLIILIGGAPGVGKSTVATQLAARLGINRVIPTDILREAMRAAFSAQLMPTLHVSSFEADTAINYPIPKGTDPVIIGFDEQVRAVSVAVKAIIDRSIVETQSMVIEGAHIVPGYVTPEVEDAAVVVPLVIAIENEAVHRSHFVLRGRDGRIADRYLKAFPNIRKVQKHIKLLAQQRNVPVIASYSLDATLSATIEHVVAVATKRATEAIPKTSTRNRKAKKK